jgi:hypothetical protein
MLPVLCHADLDGLSFDGPLLKDSNMKTTRVKREMSITHDDFLRTFPAAMGGMPYDIDGTQITGHDGGKRLEINLSNETERDVGSLELPLTFIDMDFSGFNEKEVNAFFLNWDHNFQRSGGA